MTTETVTVPREPQHAPDCAFWGARALPRIRCTCGADKATALAAAPAPLPADGVRALADTAVAGIFEDLRDRRFLKWLFTEDGRDVPILHDNRGQPLMPLEEGVQADIATAWANIIVAALSAPPLGEGEKGEAVAEPEELRRYIDRCRELSQDGEYAWWSRLVDILSAVAPPSPEAGKLAADLEEARATLRVAEERAQRAAEDERDRLFAEFDTAFVQEAYQSRGAALWAAEVLRRKGAMLPAARAASREEKPNV